MLVVVFGLGEASLQLSDEVKNTFEEDPKAKEDLVKRNIDAREKTSKQGDRSQIGLKALQSLGNILTSQ